MFCCSRIHTFKMEITQLTQKIKLKLQSINEISEDAVVEIGQLDKSFSCQNLKSLKVFNNGLKKGVPMNLVVKVLTGSDKIKEWFVGFYRNEITMYTKVVPQLGDCIKAMIPRLVYSTPLNEITLDEAVVILEDLTYLGFKATRSKFLNFEELKAALFKLGQYHGENYALKIKRPQEYQALQCLLKESYFPKTEIGVYEHGRDFADSILLMFCDRIAKSQPDSNVTVKANELADKISQKSALAITRRLRMPEEPLSIICHGDFNANNLMFSYNDPNNVDCKLIDLQQSCYLSPMVDLGFILFMNVESVQFLKENWNEIWEIYHSALTGIMRNRFGPHLQIPDHLSLKRLQDEFFKKSFIACHTVMFFHPYSTITMEELVNVELPEWFKRFGLKRNVEDDKTNETGGVSQSKLATPFVTVEERKYLEETYKRLMLMHADIDNNLEALLVFVLENNNIMNLID